MTGSRPRNDFASFPAPADLLVGDQLQRERVRQPAGELAEDLRLHQRGHLHVLGAPRVQAITLAARPELGRWGRHHVQVGIEDDLEMLPFRAAVEERARLAAGLEPLHRETRPDEVHHETERPVQLTGPVGGRWHGEQLTRGGQEPLGIHPAHPLPAPHASGWRPRPAARPARAV